MECPHCQTPLKEGYKFCSHCGAAVTPPSPEAPSPESPGGGCARGDRPSS